LKQNAVAKSTTLTVADEAKKSTDTASKRLPRKGLKAGLTTRRLLLAKRSGGHILRKMVARIE